MNESFEVIRALKKRKNAWSFHFAGTKDNIVGMAVAAGTKGYYFSSNQFYHKRSFGQVLLMKLAASCKTMYVPDAKVSFII